MWCMSSGTQERAQHIYLHHHQTQQFCFPHLHTRVLPPPPLPPPHTHAHTHTQCAQDSIEPSYLRFLLHHGGKDLRQYKAFSEVFRNKAQGNPGPLISTPTLQDLNTLRAKRGVAALILPSPSANANNGNNTSSRTMTTSSPSPSLSSSSSSSNASTATLPPAHKKDLFCQIVHPQTDSCSTHTLDFMVKAFKRSVPVYVPVYCVPLLLFNGRKMLTSPISTVGGTLTKIARSSVFLTTYMTTMYAFVCAVRNNTSIESELLGGLGVGAGGISILIEKKSRRTELALYIFSQAVLSSFNILRKKGLFPHIPHGDVYLFSVSLGIIMYAYVLEPKLMRKSYFSLFKFFFGSGEKNFRVLAEEGKEKAQASPPTSSSPLSHSVYSSSPSSSHRGGSSCRRLRYASRSLESEQNSPSLLPPSFTTSPSSHYLSKRSSRKDRGRSRSLRSRG